MAVPPEVNNMMPKESLSDAKNFQQQAKYTPQFPDLKYSKIIIQAWNYITKMRYIYVQ